MTELLMWIGIAGAGLIIGAIFYGGLWWTVRKGLTSPHPVLWFLGSLLVRMIVTVGGFYLVSQGQWERLLVCFAGFIVARLVVTWMTRPRTVNQTDAQPPLLSETSMADTGHAS